MPVMAHALPFSSISPMTTIDYNRRPETVSATEDEQVSESLDQLKFLHAEEILDVYPDLPRKQRETAVPQKYPAIFLIGVGWVLKDGYPHEMRAADYDEWVTEMPAH